MYTVDFDGTIGIRELQVYDTTADFARDDLTATQQILNFGKRGLGSGLGSIARASPSPFQKAMVSDPDNNNDRNQEAAFEDFDGEYSTSGTSFLPSQGSFQEKPLRELGIYDYFEDTSGLDFQCKFRDDQWQELNQIFISDQETFTGPCLGQPVH